MIVGDNDRDELLAQWMARYDEALATGESLEGCEPIGVDDAELTTEWEEAKNCLELLNRARSIFSAGSTHGAARGGETRCEAASIEIRQVGRFRLERELGRGGLGIVYLAYDPKLGRKVALKVPRGDTVGDVDARRRFLREAEAAARLSHPHIVALHDVGEEGSLCYLACEYCPGPTLAQWLRQRADRVSPRVAATIALALAEALHHAHSRGVLHRDIKPSNIILDDISSDGSAKCDADERSPSPKLTDFGLAKLLESTGGETRSGMILGTPAYMAPEQADSSRRDLDSRTDVYSLGAVLYEMLTGVAPYRGATDIEILRQMLLGEPASLRKLAPAVPRDLGAITLKCLAKERELRYPTAQHLADDLSRFLAGKATEARPPAAAGRLWKWARRRPAAAALLVVSVAAALGLLAVITVYNARLAESLGNARKLLYAADMQLAFDAWHGGNGTALAERIDRYSADSDPVDLRTFAWHFLHRQRYGDQKDMYRQSDTLYCAAWSPRGDVIATAGKAPGIQLWDVAAGRVLRTLAGHGSDVNDLAFSPDGRTLASCGDDLAIRLWPVDRDDAPRELKLVSLRDVLAIAYSPDGKWLAAGGADTKLRVLDTETWKLVHVFDQSTESVYGISFSPDSQTLAWSDGSDRVIVADVESGEVAFTLEFPATARSRRRMGPVAFSHDGRSIAAGRIEHGEIGLWDASTGQFLRSVASQGNWLHALAFTPDDRRLISGHQDGAMRIWNAETLQNEQVLLGHGDDVRDLAISPDGEQMVSACADGAAKCWDLAAIYARHMRHNGPWKLKTVAFSPAGDVLAFEELERSVHLVDATSGETLFKSEPSRIDADSFLAFSPDGKYLAYAIRDGRTIELLDVAARKPLRHLVAPMGRFYSAVFSPSGGLLATGDDASRLTLWDIATGKPVRTRDTGQDALFDLAFADGGQRVLTAGATEIKEWNVPALDGGAALIGSGAKFKSLAISNDDTLLAGTTSGGDIFLWNLITRQSPKLLVGHSGWSNQIDFSPDGHTMVSAGDDGTVRLWDVRTLQQIGVLHSSKDEPEKVESVALSPDGQTLAAAVGGPERSGLLLTWSLVGGPSRAPSGPP
ncbi:MAG: protein kinase [Pirellulales bacterium]